MKNNIINNFFNLIEFCKFNNIKFISFDFRRTLIDPKRKDNLFRLLKRKNISFPNLRKIYNIISSMVNKKYKKLNLYFDWTYLTLLELKEYLKGFNINYSYKSILIDLKVLEHEYINNSTPLISDKDFNLFILNCLNNNIKININSDGFFIRENKAIKKLFSDSIKNLDSIITTEEIGYSKYSYKFYLSFSKKIDLPPENILFIGDKIEKDIVNSLKAGCKAILINTHYNIHNFINKNFGIISNINNIIEGLK